MTQSKDTSLALRIQSRLKKVNKSERAASLEAGLSNSFLRNIREGKSSAPRADTLEKIAKVLDTNSAWLMTGAGEEETPPAAALQGDTAQTDAVTTKGRKKQGERRLSQQEILARYEQRRAADMVRPFPRDTFYPPADTSDYGEFHESGNAYIAITPSSYPPHDPFGKDMYSEHLPNARIGESFALSERRLPVYGQAVGGIDGEFPINGSALYSVLCPPQLSEISGAYAVSISGDSMYPRYEDGEIAFVDPTRRVKKGDYVIAQITGDEGDPPLAYVKKFIRHNAAELILEQFNPQKELVFPHLRVVSVHYIALAGTAPA